MPYVDDNDDNVYMLMCPRTLGRFEVITAEDGGGLRDGLYQRPDIVLMTSRCRASVGGMPPKGSRSSGDLRHPRVSVIGARPRWQAREGTSLRAATIRYRTGSIRSTGREAAAAASHKIGGPGRADQLSLSRSPGSHRPAGRGMPPRSARRRQNRWRVGSGPRPATTMPLQT